MAFGLVTVVHLLRRLPKPRANDGLEKLLEEIQSKRNEAAKASGPPELEAVHAVSLLGEHEGVADDFMMQLISYAAHGQAGMVKWSDWDSLLRFADSVVVDDGVPEDVRVSVNADLLQRVRARWPRSSEQEAVKVALALLLHAPLARDD